MSTTEQRHLFPTTESDPSNEYPCLCTFVHRHTHKLWQAKSYIRQTQGFHVEPTVGEEASGWKSERRAERRGWRREKLRQGLLTDSDGYHFIRDTILRLPQPTRSPSPSPMPPTTDLIWSEPTPIQTFTSPLAVYMYIRRLLLPPSPRTLLLSSSSLLSATRFSVYPALVLLIFNRRRERERHTARWNRRDDSGIEHRSGLIVGCSVLKRYIHTAYGSFL